MSDCIGCKNIQGEHFPFTSFSWADCGDGLDYKGEKDLRIGKFFIDTEHQGITKGGKRDPYLEIFYCPVCGRALSSENAV